MSLQFEGVLLSAALVCGVLFFGWAIGKVQGLPREFSRKFVHIGVSCFYFIYAKYIYGADIWLEIALPLVFIAANAYVAISGKPKALAIAMSGGNKFGTVYYPIALVVLITLMRVTDIGLDLDDFGAGVLMMGFGDALAGLVGSQAKGRRIAFLPENKTWVGSAVMMAVSFIVIMLVYEKSFNLSSPEVWRYLLCAFFATVVEALTPRGLDNLSVPILVSLFCMLVV